MKKGKNPLSLKRSSVMLVKALVSQEGYYILVIMEKKKQHSSETAQLILLSAAFPPHLGGDTGVDEGRSQWLL